MAPFLNTPRNKASLLRVSKSQEVFIHSRFTLVPGTMLDSGNARVNTTDTVPAKPLCCTTLGVSLVHTSTHVHGTPRVEKCTAYMVIYGGPVFLSL